MIKNFYILIIIICFSVTKSDKKKSKNLRGLNEIPTVSLSSADGLIYESGKLKFGINLASTTEVENRSYDITIIYRGEKKLASCQLSGSSMSCEYSCDSPHYGSIKIASTSEALDTSTINLQISTGTTKTLRYKGTQEFSLAYNNAVIGLIDSTHYNIKVYLRTGSSIPTLLVDKAYADLDLDVGTGYSVAGCIYSSSSRMLDCEVSGSFAQKVEFIGEKREGTIKWTSSDFPEDSVIMNIEAQTKIYGYDLDFLNGKWNFKVHMVNTDITFSGYYCYLNVILKNKADNEESAKALCHRKEAKYLECVLSEGTQNSDDLVYISPDQTGATVSFKDNILTSKKIMVRLIALKFIDAYDLYFESSKWHFKIEVEAEGTSASIVREGLNVTVALYYSSYETASCIYSNTDGKKILSCDRDKTGQNEVDLLYLAPKKSVGSVTWSNLNEGSDNLNIALAVELTHVKSYDLIYENSKWAFKIDACPSVKIPAKSFIRVDILYDTSQYTTAECIGIYQNAGTISARAQTTYNCVCDLDITKSFQISNIKKAGSVTWKSLSQQITIEKKNGLKFIGASKLVLASENKWTFEIEFNAGTLTPKTTDTYKIDIDYTTSSTSTVKQKGAAECTLKEEGANALACYFTISNAKDVAFHINKIATPTAEFIQWTEWVEGIGDYYQLDLNTELTFEKGSVKAYDNKWFLEINVKDPKDGILPINSKVIIDIIKGSSDSTIECIVISSLFLKCDTKIISSSASDLPYYTIKKTKSTSSTVLWKNTETDEKFFYFYLFSKLDYKSAYNNIFSSNKWRFDLDTSVFPDKTKIIIDILFDGQPSTASCIKESTISCVVDEDNQSKSILVKVNHIKSDKSTITWNSLSVDPDIFISKELNVQSVKQLFYRENTGKWAFKMNLVNSDLPINGAVKVAINYKSKASTASCIQESINILTCSVDEDDQRESDTLSISSSPTLGCVTYNSDSNLAIVPTINLKFEKAYDLTINGNNWEFKIKLSGTNLNNNDEINIDIKVNNNNKSSKCKYNSSSKVLTCTVAKTNNDDKIVLISNEDNQDLIWYYLTEKELYIAYNIKFVNYYGGFYANQWVFNLKYDNTEKTIDITNNYVLLDILVNYKPNTALCKISPKFLVCVSQHETQTNTDQIKINSSPSLGTVTLSNLPSSIEALTPISITLGNKEISDFNYSNNVIKFKIKGNLKGGESEIAENTITYVEIVVNQNSPIDALCLTNSINNSPVELTCEARGSMNIDEDDVAIKVDSNGKSKYITFDGTKENISIPKNNKVDNSKKNNSLMAKINFIFLFGLYLMF